MRIEVLGREADTCVLMVLGALALLAFVAALHLFTTDPARALPAGDTIPTQVHAVPPRPPGAGPGLHTLELILGGFGLAWLAISFFLALRACARPGRRAEESARLCKRCSHEQSRQPFGACQKCGAPSGCPCCGLDLTTTTTDICPACHLAWGCPRCGYSFKGLTSNPCPHCGAPYRCERCGTDLLHNITGRCGKCGAGIRGWREWWPAESTAGRRRQASDSRRLAQAPRCVTTLGPRPLAETEQ